MSPKRPLRQPAPEDKQAMWDFHAAGYSVRAIAAEVGFSYSTVSHHLSRMGADMDRSQTAEATAARVRILRAKRVTLAEELMNDAFSMRHRVWDEYTQYIGGPEGPVEVHMDEPPLPEQGHGMKAIDVTVNTIDRLLSGADSGESEASKNVLADIMKGLAGLIDDGDGLGELDQDHEYNIADDPDQVAQ